MPSSTSWAVGFGCCARRPTTDITKPGVQKPHCSQAFDLRHVVSFSLHGEHEAGAHRRAVEQNRAASANPMLAADMRAGEAEVVTQVVGEQAARIARRGV